MNEYQLVEVGELSRLRLSDLTYKDAMRQKALAEDERDEWEARAKRAEAKLEMIEEAELAIAERDATWDDEHPCDSDCPCEVETRAIDYDRLVDAIVEALQRDREDRMRSLMGLDRD